MGELCMSGKIEIIIEGSNIKDLETLAFDAIADINAMDGEHTAYIKTDPTQLKKTPKKLE